MVKTTVWLPEKPLPLTPTVSPTNPPGGESVIFGATENGAVAEPPLSVAFSVWLPWVIDGMVNVQLKVPFSSLLTVEGDVVKLVVSVSREIAMLFRGPALKPLPVTVNVSPTTPVIGKTTILELTENGWDGTPGTDVEIV